MQGGFFHEYMLDELETAFRKQGFVTKRQVRSKAGRTSGSVDLLVKISLSNILICEVEMDSKRRVDSDLQKQKDLGNGTVLWIVTPTKKLAESIKAYIRSLELATKEAIFVFPFGTALSRILNKSNLVSPAKVKKENKKTKVQKSQNSKRS